MKHNIVEVLWTLIKRECRRIVAKPIYLFCIIVAPIFTMVFFLTMMKDGLPTALPIAVVDMDNSSTSRRAGRMLDSFQQVEVVMRTASFEEARERMQQGDLYGIFYIPKDFAKDASSGKQPKISYYSSNSFLIAASLAYRDMKTVATLMNASVGLQMGEAKGISYEQLMATLQPISIDTHPIGNPWLNYSIYLNNTILPGIIELLIFLVTIFTIGTEVKYSTARRWLSLTKNNLSLALLGKMIPYTVSFTIIGFLCSSVLYGYSHFPLANGPWPMLVAMFFLVISSQAMGIFLFTLVPSMRLALGVASLLGVLAFSLAGFSFPVSDMPPAIQALTNLWPLRHYFLIYVDQALIGRSIHYSVVHYASMLAFLLLPIFLMRNLKNVLLYIKYIP